MLTIRPVTSRLARKLLKPELPKIAERTYVLDEGKEWNAAPLIQLEDTLDRIVGHQPNSNPNTNRLLIECRGYEQGPLIAYRLRDALVADGAVMTATWTRSMYDRKHRLVIWDEGERLEEAAMCSTMMSERFFGHWLHDQLPQELLAEEMHLPTVAVTGVHRPNEPGYRFLTGLHAQTLDVGRVKRLWMFADDNINAHRVRRLEELRARIRSQVPSGGPERVFIGRGSSANGRVLVNEAEIADTLSKDGIAYLITENMEAREIAWHLRDAKVVFGPEGSAQAHAVCAMPRGSTLFSFMPPRQFNMIFRIYCEAVGLRFAIDIGDDIDFEHFAMPVERIRRMLDLIDIQCG